LVSLIGGIITVLWRISDMKSVIAGHAERIKAAEKSIADLESIPEVVASMQSVCAERHGRRRSIKV
jgi:hypothetical protein